MNESIRNLEPTRLWNNFADLNAVPRASKKEEQVIEFIKKFGNNLGLETFEDEVRNVIIRKPATLGMENRKGIVLQSHLDMVHQKNNDKVFDFATQGIEMYVDGDWVKASGTTLGADNGLGVATIMAILESKDIAHPAIDALFTIDEETGMTGAMGLKGGLLKGEILLNLDTEEDNEIGVGCAGGVDVTASKNYSPQSVPKNAIGYKIIVKGLQGGHSGMEIQLGLANANKIMNRILIATNQYCYVSSILGGSLRNAIPRESNAQIVVVNESKFMTAFEKIKTDLLDEYHPIESQMIVSIEKLQKVPETIISFECQHSFLKAVAGAHNGVFRMSPAINNLVETSNNVAKIILDKGLIKIDCLTRSSVESSKENMVSSLRSVFELAGFEVNLSGDYPGWAPNMDSAILKVLDSLYEKINGEKAHVAACHAGLECGILGTNYPKMDMISFGPTIKGAHSPDERASISSTQKFWNFLKAILKEIPLK
ncbi:MAG: aminoacyl-histidine dipeptidase [Flavobacteriales bacterium]|nr:MAG: aminoacyl-histidine dipeptidase [Flavobacteriales bacterium]